RGFVGCTVSTLHRPTGRAVIPSPSVTVAVVRWWVIKAIVRWPRVIILRLGRQERAQRDSANAANSPEYSRCAHSGSRQRSYLIPAMLGGGSFLCAPPETRLIRTFPQI